MSVEQRFFETQREEKMHEQFNELKKDPHLEGVEWGELEALDIDLLDRFTRGTLTRSAILERMEALEEEEGRVREDPSANFCAALLTKLILLDTKKRKEGGKELRESQQGDTV